MKVKSSNRDTRIALLEAGLKLMLEKGYTSTGIQDVLAKAGVPKGSFYHYFNSKEDFALQMIEYFNGKHSARLFNTLHQSNLSPVERLMAFCLDGVKSFQDNECRGGCLIGNLSQEMADQSETLRVALDSVLNGWEDLFAECIQEGQGLGEIKSKVPAEQLAEHFVSAWGGAVTRAKCMKSLVPLGLFVEMMFEHMLQAEPVIVRQAQEKPVQADEIYFSAAPMSAEIPAQGQML